MKHFTSKTQRVGELGEKICLQYLKQNSFSILDTNYTKACGEIDIIAKKKNILHFIEVKSSVLKSNVSYETYDPAQNLTHKKLYKIQKTVEIYLSEYKVSHETPWQIDLYCAFVDIQGKKHKIKVIENITS